MSSPFTNSLRLLYNIAPANDARQFSKKCGNIFWVVPFCRISLSSAEARTRHMGLLCCLVRKVEYAPREDALRVFVRLSCFFFGMPRCWQNDTQPKNLNCSTLSKRTHSLTRKFQTIIKNASGNSGGVSLGLVF